MAKKVITKKQKEIQILIYSFRFINSKQIQRFLGHRDHRRINSWLKDLGEKQYINRDFKQRFGTSTKPAVYSLASKGRKYIRKNYSHVSPRYLERIADDQRERSKAFRIKCQLIADFYLIFFKNYIKEFPQTLERWLTWGVRLKYNQYQFFTPAFYKDLDFVLLSPLKPDAYYYIRRKEGITHVMIYILDAYIPRIMLNYSLKNIFAKLDGEYWEDDTIDSLHSIFVCPNNMVIVYLRRLLSSFLKGYYGATPLIFHFTTRNKLFQKQKYQGSKWIDISSEDH